MCAGFILRRTSWTMGSGCGSVGTAVASDTRGPRFHSSHQKTYLFILNCIEKTTIKEKRDRDWPRFKKNNFNNYLIGHNTCKLFPFLILLLLTYFALCSIWGWLHFSLSHFISLSFASKQKGKNQLL